MYPYKFIFNPKDNENAEAFLESPNSRKSIIHGIVKEKNHEPIKSAVVRISEESEDKDVKTEPKKEVKEVKVTEEKPVEKSAKKETKDEKPVEEKSAAEPVKKETNEEKPKISKKE
mgnify:CR=1 FL=1